MRNFSYLRHGVFVNSLGYQTLNPFLGVFGYLLSFWSKAIAEANKLLAMTSELLMELGMITEDCMSSFNRLPNKDIH